ncbi:MAG: ZIP family metal transporter [Clostridia bacterium]|nr:ZIP family metal transporter [Clostridia bacterium]
MEKIIAAGILLPFIGTVSGAACVFFMKNGTGHRTNDILAGFAAGVMTAASVWSLLLPALETAKGENAFLSFLPAGAGFICGMLLLMLGDRFLPRVESEYLKGRSAGRPGSTGMLVLAVTLHNFPEGLAVGVALAAFREGAGMTAAAATALAVGIAVQNFPEGAIVSLPLKNGGKSRARAFAGGALSGAVEPLGALITLFFSHLFAPAMPFLLSFAAGAMIYVVIEELVPGFAEGDGPHYGTPAFTAGFAVMMALDCLL